MNIKSTYIFMLAALCVAGTMNAQVVDQNVTVEREYKPVIQDAGKITSNPQALDVTISKKKAVYSDFNLPLSVEQNLATLAAAPLAQEKREDLGSFVRLGAGNYWNTLADLALPLVKTENTHLDFQLNHFGSFADSMAFSSTKANLLFGHDFSKNTLYAGVGCGYEYETYYGENFDRTRTPVNLTSLVPSLGNATYYEMDLVAINRNPQSVRFADVATAPSDNHNWQLNAFVGLKSLQADADLKYDGQLKYDLFDSHNGLTENRIRTVAAFEDKYKNDKVGVNVEVNNLFYSSDYISDFNFWKSYSVVSVNPYYNIENEKWKVRLGLKSSFSVAHGKPFNPSPDIYGEIKMVPQWLAVYAGVTGSYDINSLSSMYDENRYLYQDVRVKDTYIPVNAYLGTRIKPLYHLYLDAYVNYKYINNQYFFVNKAYAYDLFSSTLFDQSSIYTNRFNVIYSPATLLKIGARANYHLRDVVNIELTGAYNGWDVSTEEYAWNKPKFEFALNTGVQLNRNLNVAVNAFYESERFANLGGWAVRMKPVLDCNIGATYLYTKQLSFFARINNLLNSHYEYYYGYKVEGLNAMIGASYSFK